MKKEDFLILAGIAIIVFLIGIGVGASTVENSIPKTKEDKTWDLYRDCVRTKYINARDIADCELIRQSK